MNQTFFCFIFRAQILSKNFEIFLCQCKDRVKMQIAQFYDVEGTDYLKITVEHV